jgi:hypothetical protein
MPRQQPIALCPGCPSHRQQLIALCQGRRRLSHRQQLIALCQGLQGGTTRCLQAARAGALPPGPLPSREGQGLICAGVLPRGDSVPAAGGGRRCSCSSGRGRRTSSWRPCACRPSRPPKAPSPSPSSRPPSSATPTARALRQLAPRRIRRRKRARLRLHPRGAHQH